MQSEKWIRDEAERLAKENRRLESDIAAAISDRERHELTQKASVVPSVVLDHFELKCCSLMLTYLDDRSVRNLKLESGKKHLSARRMKPSALGIGR